MSRARLAFALVILAFLRTHRPGTRARRATHHRHHRTRRALPLPTAIAIACESFRPFWSRGAASRVLQSDVTTPIHFARYSSTPRPRRTERMSAAAAHAHALAFTSFSPSSHARIAPARAAAPAMRRSAAVVPSASATGESAQTKAPPAALRQFPDAPAPIIEHDDVQGWTALETKLIAACASNIGDESVNARFKAVALLGASTTYEAVNELSVVEVYTQVYEGDLTTCSTIIDVHLRMLAECMIDGDWSRVANAYNKFHNLPPALKRQSLLATAAVAEAAILFTMEEYEYMVSILKEEYEKPDASDELKEEYQINLEMVAAMTKMIEEMTKNKDERDRA